MLSMLALSVSAGFRVPAASCRSREKDYAPVVEKLLVTWQATASKLLRYNDIPGLRRGYGV